MDIKEKIINATIDIIETEGINKVTTRKIAKKAGVNVAAINYYFGNQNNLIKNALDKTLDNAFKDPINELDKNETLFEILKKIILEWFEGSLNYPNITKAHFYDPFVNNNYKTVAVKRLNKFFNELHNFIIKNYSEIDERKLRDIIIQIFGAIFFYLLFPNLTKDYSGTDFYNKKQREQFVDSFLKKFINKNIIK